MTPLAANSHDRQALTLTIPQAAQLLGISVSKAYEAARLGDLPIIRIGSRVLISRKRLEAMVDGISFQRDRDGIGQ